MFSRLARALALFHEREDGLTKVEYGVMLGLLSIGCLVAITLGGPSSRKDPHTFTINFGGDWSRTSRAESWNPKGLNGTDKNDANDGLALASSELENDAARKQTSERGMSEGDARHALAGLLKAYPESFAVSKHTVQTTAIAHKADHIEIGPFRCYLQTRTFVYAPPQAGSGQSGECTSGVFYRLKNGDWTGTISVRTQK